MLDERNTSASYALPRAKPTAAPTHPHLWLVDVYAEGVQLAQLLPQRCDQRLDLQNGGHFHSSLGTIAAAARSAMTQVQ